MLRQSPATVEHYDLSVVRTRGNHSYIPLNIKGTPANHIEEILGALQVFEKAHLEIEVTGWNVDKQGAAYAIPPYIYGLWVDHRPSR